MGQLTLEDGNYKLSRNVDKKLPIYTAQNSRKAQIPEYMLMICTFESLTVVNWLTDSEYFGDKARQNWTPTVWLYVIVLASRLSGVLE
jgi:hypothetical protein